jgi:hypothetical protein
MNIHEDEHARGGIEEGGNQLTHPFRLNINAAEEQDQLLHRGKITSSSLILFPLLHPEKTCHYSMQHMHRD